MRKMCVRKLLLLLFFLMMLAVAAAHAQPGKRKDASQSTHLYQVYRDDRRTDRPSRRQFGFIDNTGKLVIDFERLPVTTDSVGEFHDGRALIWLKKSEGTEFSGINMGYIDDTGQIVIAPRFDYARDFSEGLAYVEKEGFHGYIDTQGKPVIKLDGLATEFQMKEGSPQGRDFHEGLAAVGTGQWPDRWYRDAVQWGGLWGYINRSGKLVIKPEFRYADNFSEGLAGVVTNANRQFGFINKHGQMVIKPRFYTRPGGPHGFGIGGTSYFSEGLACVMEADRDLYGYINKKGDYVIPPQFTHAIAFSEGLAWVVAQYRQATGSTLKVGWIDKSGQWVVARADEYGVAQFSPLSYSEGLAPFFVYIGEKFLWGYMDKSGAEVIKPQFDRGSNFVGGIAQVSVNKEVYGYIDKKGQFIWKPK